MKKIGIVMGSASDLPVVKKAMDMLDAFGVEYEAHIFSAHRTPEEARDFALNARERGFGAMSFMFSSNATPKMRFTSSAQASLTMVAALSTSSMLISGEASILTIAR